MPDGSMIIPLIINILIVSIPEESFLVVFSLILMNRYDLIELKKSNIIKISCIVLPVVVLTNILRAFGGMDGNIMPFITFAAVFFPMILLFKIKSPKGILKAFISLCISILVILLLTLMFFPLISTATNFDFQLLNKPGILTILLSLPGTICEILLVSFFLLKKKAFMKMGLFKVIARNKILANVTGIVVFLNFLFLYLMFRLIYLDKILIDLSMAMQILIVIMIIFFPILNMTVLISVITYSVNKLTYAKVHIQEESKVLRILVKMLIQQKKIEDIDGHLNSFIEEVKKL